MRLRKLNLSVSLSDDELSNIRNVILAWGKSQAIANDFDGSKLHELFYSLNNSGHTPIKNQK